MKEPSKVYVSASDWYFCIYLWNFEQGFLFICGQNFDAFSKFLHTFAKLWFMICIWHILYLILQKENEYIFYLSLWGNSFFWTWKKLPLHPWETHMLFLKKLEGHRSISTSQHGTPYYIQQCFNLLQHRSWILGQLGKQEDATFDTAIFRSSTPRVAL